MSRSYRVLYLEDDPKDYELVKSLLDEEGILEKMHLARDRQQFESALQKGDYDIVLVDYNLPQIDGVTALEMSREKDPDIPVIVISGTIGEEVAVETLKRGAADYLLKDRLVVRLAPLIKKSVEEAEQRKQSQEERNRLTTAIEQTDETVVITDKQGGILYANPAFERITGYSSAHIIGQNFGLVRSDKQDDSFYKVIDDRVSSGQVWKGHFTNKRKDGSLYENAATISPIKNARGEITGFVNIGRDITDDIKLQEQLRQAQKMEAIGTLAGGIAHDFNNILGAILGYAELSLESLDEADDQTQINGFLEQVIKASTRAKDLVAQILTFSRSKEIEKKAIRTSPIVKEVCKFLRASLPATIEIDHHIAVDNDRIMADPSQFYQILMNLCTNASHAMQETGGQLEVRLENINKPSPFLKLTVKDTGHGIAQKNLGRIFEPYFTTKEKGHSTGLGLAVVHGIVEEHGGEIAVASKRGKGTVFHVLLPLLHESVQPDPTERFEPLPTGRERLLIVDDEQSLVTIAEKILCGLGYQVSAVTNAADAIGLFQQSKEPYDLAVIDKTMPKMTGFELARELRKLQIDLPIVLTSGFVEKSDEAKLREAGIDAILPKPLDRQELAQTIRRILG